MNFKKIGLGLAATVAMTSVAVLEAPAAKAASLAPGGFALQATGNPSVTSSGTGAGSTDTLNFSALNFNITETTGEFIGVLTEDADGIGTDGIVINPLKLTSLGIVSGAELFSNAGVTQFITGLKLGSDDIVFDLDSSNSLASFSLTNGSYVGASLNGVLRKVNGGQAVASATLASLKFGTGLTNIQVETVPTPALLPGLIGMGVAALRKKRKDEEFSATPDAAEECV